MSGGLLESTLLLACPGLRDEWEAVRRSHDGASPGDQELLAHVRLHVVGLLACGRAAEFTRFAGAVERLLGDADPVLSGLLETQLIRPLARDVEDARIAPSLMIPHLGRRMRASWIVNGEP